jgi:hypothetical protein
MKLEELRFGTELIKRGFASMQKGGVIMDVVNAEQARLAEEAGAVALPISGRPGAWPAWPTRRGSSRSSMRSPSR